MAELATLQSELSELIDLEVENGMTFTGESAAFIPTDVVHKYWTISRIRQLSQITSINIPPDFLQSQYRIVLSILVTISSEVEGSLGFFDKFVSNSIDDLKIPLTGASWLERDERGRRVSKAFQEAQWRFCPFLLDPNKPSWDTPLDRRCILAFTDRKSMGKVSINGESSVASVAVIRKAHRHLIHASKIPSRIVLKTYPQSSRDSYNKERKAYAVLSTRSPNILRCLGSYRLFTRTSERTSVLIFEYAEGGTLLDHFKRREYPSTPTEIVDWWHALLDTVLGLEIIHGLQGIHQDLKPSNILVFPQVGNSRKYVFKIADFGESHIPTRSSSSDPVYARATRTYSAPEFHLADDVRYNASSTLDIWSIGCILVEAAIWISLGEDPRIAFRKRRIQETSRLPQHHARSRLDCFHDGENTLESVRDIPRRIPYNGRAEDDISRQVVKLALKELLVPKACRLEAYQLYARLAEIIHKSKVADLARNSYESMVASQTVAPGGIETGRPLPSTRRLQNTSHTPSGREALQPQDPAIPSSTSNTTIPDSAGSLASLQLYTSPATRNWIFLVSPLAVVIVGVSGWVWMDNYGMRQS